MTSDWDSLSALSVWTQPASHSVLNRRRLLGWATGVGATVAAVGLGLGASRPVVAGRQDAVLPATGHTWLLTSPDALRPEAPPAPTAAEIDEILDLQADRTDEIAATVARWSSRPAVFPWLDLGMQLTAATFPPGLLEIRAQALLRTAMHDAVVAAVDAQAAYARPAPAVADDRVTPVGDASGARSSFPSEHAAVAGAAATVLAYLFPDASPDQFTGLADEAATSRLWAGANYRSDIEAGLAIGRAVGELAVAHGMGDGSDAEWDGTGRLTGDGYYEPTPPNFVDPPFGPLAGTWTTWVLPRGDAIRPAPFPEYGSPLWYAELAAVREATKRRTLAQERIIDYWLSKLPNGFYTEYAQNMIERENLGEAQAASVLAMVSVAQYDALVAIWDAKYHYWVARPSTMSSEIDLYIPDPPYPTYPGGFAGACGAGAAVLADLFPAAEVDLMTSAWEGSVERGWSGIHYVLDNDVGLLMGTQVGRLVVDVVRGDRAESED